MAIDERLVLEMALQTSQRRVAEIQLLLNQLDNLPKRGRPTKVRVVDMSQIMTPPAPPQRRTMSASARRKIAAAQKQRWAAHKIVEEANEEATLPAKKKFKLSAATRKRMSEAQKKRYMAAH